MHRETDTLGVRGAPVRGPRCDFGTVGDDGFPSRAPSSCGHSGKLLLGAVGSSSGVWSTIELIKLVKVAHFTFSLSLLVKM